MRVPAEISVIIATMAAPERAQSLQRAIASVRAASTRPVQVIVVVNGARSEAGLLEWLGQQADVLLELAPEPSLPKAILRGRELVQTPYFATLDDDDEFLPGALDCRMQRMQQADQPALVVTNGIRRTAEGDRLTYSSMANIEQRPLPALFDFTWLQSCNGLYRSEAVGPDWFANYHAYAEWTWLAFSLAQAGKCIGVVDAPTYVNNDTPGSLSKSASYFAAYFALFQRMLAVRPPPNIEKLVRRRLGACLHEDSVRALAAGRRADAWLAHLRSLGQPGGLRFLSYTRRLLPGWPQD